MTDLVPAGGIFSWAFKLQDGGRDVAVVKPAWFSERAEATADGAPLRFEREGWRGRFVARGPTGEIASATKRSAWTRDFDVHVGKRVFELRPAGAFSRAFRLLDERGADAGGVRPRGWFGIRSEVTAPPELPPAARAFIAWLAMLMWRRQAASS
ncbi:MAG TPA: hypothetical protein VEI02_07045 [Planctomycetota bacterium]|nr:hypothetical protein [Planctomycetota bacterium]